MIDPKTGQLFFHPLTFNTNSFREYNPHIFEQLYKEYESFKNNRELETELHYKEIIEKTNTKKVSSKSEEITSTLIMQCFENLFNVLVGTSEILSYNEYFVEQFNCLDQLIKQFIEPIVIEMKENSETLNKKEFMMACEQLFRMIKWEERRKVLDWYEEIRKQNSLRKKHQNHDNKNFTFKPLISINSRDIYSNSEKIKKDFLERNMDHLRKKEEFTNFVKEQLVQMEMTGN